MAEAWAEYLHYLKQTEGRHTNIAIVDDIRRDAELLAETVEAYMSVHSISCGKAKLFASGEDFLRDFKPAVYNILFLDIYMTGMSGMDTAHDIRKLDSECSIIFVTTSPDFAVDSYEVNADYYLLKPVNREQVFRALDRCDVNLMERNRYVLVPSHDLEYKLFLHDISYTEYINRRILVHMQDKSIVEINMSQRDFSLLLLQHYWFCDCIKGVLVNLEDVYKLLNDRFVMKSGASIPISRLKYNDVREKYLDYSFKALREGHEL